MLAFSRANLKICHLILDDDISVVGSVTTWNTPKSRAAQEAPTIGLWPQSVSHHEAMWAGALSSG